MTPSLTEMRIPDGILVTVPDSLTFMTPYVLYEQGDWFEDEIRFVRSFVKSGMYVIDIGANYGVYTLTMALKTGSGGKVLAFEPTTAVADCLSRSIEKNNFSNIELVKAGLSDKVEPARLSLNENPETNSLSNSAPGALFETVLVTTLDECMDSRGMGPHRFYQA